MYEVSVLMMRTKKFEVFAAVCIFLIFFEALCNAEESPGVCPPRVTHSRDFLLSLRTSQVGTIPSNIPVELCKPRPKTKHRKRGRRGGTRRRLKTLRLDDRRKLPPLPSVLLSNVQSIRNKIDELETYAKFKSEIKNTCLLAFTETWLSELDQDSE